MDFISGQSGDPAAALQVNELQISCLKGIDLAFAACDEVEVVGAMPDGTENTVRVRVVRPEAYILIKAFALDERAKDKDAYDIAFVLQNFQPSLMVLAERARKLLETELARDGLRILQAKFATLASVGPEWAARVSREQGEDFEQARRAAFENAQDLFRHVFPDTSPPIA